LAARPTGRLRDFFAGAPDQRAKSIADILPLDIPNPVEADVIRYHCISSLEF